MEILKYKIKTEKVGLFKNNIYIKTDDMVIFVPITGRITYNLVNFYRDYIDLGMLDD